MSISRFLFLLPPLSLILSLNSFAAAPPDTVWRPSVTAGMEVTGLGRELLEPGSRQWEWSLSLEWREDWFATLEAGMLNTAIDRVTHNYFADGWFVRAGADYNLLKRDEKNLHDLILLIFRYGYGRLNHESTRIIITDPYWGSYETALPLETFQAHWLELGVGIKARITGPLYMGWSIRTRLMLTRTQDLQMDPYKLGGFGKLENNPTVGIRYSLFFKIPV